MNIHFSIPVAGNKQDCVKIADLFAKEGHRLVTRYYIERKKEDRQIKSSSASALFSTKVMRWITQADLVVFAISRPGAEVGLDLAIALSRAKPIIVLYRENMNTIPLGFKGLDDELLQIISYTDKNLPQVLLPALDWASEQADIRFNFPLDRDTAKFLAAAARRKQISRAAFLQQLLEKEKLLSTS